MARPQRIEYPGAFYHVTSRGNERKYIFRSIADRERFLGYLESATCRYGAVIHAYCLLSNHYHLLLLEKPASNLSEIMRHINGAYTTCFNLRRKRAGHLFQGRYKAILVEADAYAAELSRYIHLNPLRAGMVETPEDYRWSGYAAYIGLVEPAPWLKTDFILGLLSRELHAAQSAYREFVEARCNAVDESPLNNMVSSTILGGEAFVREVVARYAGDGPDTERPDAIKNGAERPSTDKALAVVETELAGQEKLARKIAVYLWHHLTGATLKRIGKRFGLKESAVSQASRRLGSKLREDKPLAAQVSRLEKSLAAMPKGSARGRTESGRRRGLCRGGEAVPLLRDINRVLEDFPEVRFCTLFGSAGQGRLTARSDMDVAVAGEQKLSVETRVRLAGALFAALGRQVDLQDVAGLILEQTLCRSKVVKNADHSLYAQLLKRLWYNQADMMPYVKRVL